MIKHIKIRTCFLCVLSHKKLGTELDPCQINYHKLNNNNNRYNNKTHNHNQFNLLYFRKL